MTIEGDIDAVKRTCDDIAAKLLALSQQVTRVETAVVTPARVWEPIAVACRIRGRGRVAFINAGRAGQIGMKTVPGRGGLNYLFKIEDLDRVFPVIADDKKTPGLHPGGQQGTLPNPGDAIEAPGCNNV